MRETPPRTLAEMVRIVPAFMLPQPRAATIRHLVVVAHCRGSCSSVFQFPWLPGPGLPKKPGFSQNAVSPLSHRTFTAGIKWGLLYLECSGMSSSC